MAKVTGSKKTNSKKRAPHEKVYLTEQGLEDIKSELDVLKKIKRPEATERIQKARDFANSEENTEYDSAMEEQAIIENRILTLENVVKNASLIQEESSNDFVVIGSTVKIEMDGDIDEFTIVGKLEANPAKKKISNESPVGSAILGVRVGEEVEVHTPIVKYKCKVLEIR